MLSDYERRVLRELEGQFMSDDPTFPRSFDIRAQQLGRRRLGTPARLAIVVALLLSVPMLAVGSLAGALAFSTATGLIWLAWRHSTDRTTRPPDADRST